MAKLREADQGILFASCILNTRHFDRSRLDEIWNSRYELAGELAPSFNPSLEYYSKEMGGELERLIVWTERPRERGELVDGKLWADQIERETALAGARTVNIDIGIILKEQLLLSTSKPYSHRIFLRDGVWAELAYVYEKGTYRCLPWTYPDYGHAEKIQLFNRLRKKLFFI